MGNISLSAIATYMRYPTGATALNTASGLTNIAISTPSPVAAIAAVTGVAYLIVDNIQNKIRKERIPLELWAESYALKQLSQQNLALEYNAQALESRWESFPVPLGDPTPVPVKISSNLSLIPAMDITGNKTLTFDFHGHDTATLILDTDFISPTDIKLTWPTIIPQSRVVSPRLDQLLNKATAYIPVSDLLTSPAIAIPSFPEPAQNPAGLLGLSFGANALKFTIQNDLSIAKTAANAQFKAENTLKKDRKPVSAQMYVALLNLVSNTFGTITEVLDFYNSLMSNMYFDPTGPMTFRVKGFKHNRDFNITISETTRLSSLPMNLQTHILFSLTKGKYQKSVKFDFEGFTSTFLQMQLTDAAIGLQSTAERAMIRSTKAGGILNFGNLTTWARRAERLTNQRLLPDTMSARPNYTNQTKRGTPHGIPSIWSHTKTLNR